MYRLFIFTVLLLLLLPATAGADCGYRADCDSGCQQYTCTRPAYDSCDTGCMDDCDAGCAKPCACLEWHTYCGCEMLTGMTISLEIACDGATAGPLKLLLRDNDFDDIVTIELAGPIEGYYTAAFEFTEPIRADSIKEAVIINDTDDSATLNWFNVYGMFDYCGGWSYFDFTCSGAVIGADGCPRMVLF